jgi:hypothetical protein
LLRAARRVAVSAAIAAGAAGCVSNSEYNSAILRLDDAWKAENAKTLATLGRRTVAASPALALLAARGATRELGMLVEKENAETGFLLVTAAAPTPLTHAEWTQVQRTDTPNMREIISKDVGAVSWFVTLDPSAKDVLANVLVTQRPKGAEVSIGLRLRSKSTVTGRARRSQPPPTALRIGLHKFWAAFDGELAALKRTADARPAAPIAADVPARRGVAGVRNADAVAVVIGNRKYRPPVPDVDYAHNDADAMKRFVTERLGYAPGNVIDLRDATFTDLVGVFGSAEDHKGKLWRWMRPGVSDVVVFYSGHGVPDPKARRGFLLAVDGDPDAPALNGYPIDQLYRNLAELKARSRAVFLDACFSGESQRGQLIAGRSGLVVSPAMPAAQVPGELTVITAAGDDQVASWDSEKRLGLFTRYLLEGLSGAADAGRHGNGDGAITAAEIKSYLDREMTYAARRRYGRIQNATVAGDPARVLARF